MKLFSVVFLSCLLAACATSPKSTGQGPTPTEFKLASLAKTEVDQIADLHLQASLEHLRLVTEKLYRRNPREWKKGGQASLEAAVERIYEGNFQKNFTELGEKRGIQAIVSIENEIRGEPADPADEHRRQRIAANKLSPGFHSGAVAR